MRHSSALALVAPLTLAFACSNSEGGAKGSGAAGGATTGGSGATSQGGTAAGGEGGSPAGSQVSLLVFSRTGEYRHDSIPNGITALTKLALDYDWELLATEDPTTFTDETLAEYDAVVFLSTSEEVLDTAQQAAFERYIRAGNGYVGIHAASATEFDWPWYGELVGAYFREHPEIQEADIVVEDATHPSTVELPNPWVRTDEWYSFRTNPRNDVTVLLSLDETSYAPGASEMAGDHPIAWCHEFDGGRSFYTALGHTAESYTEARFLAHVTGGIEWVLAR